MQHIALKLSSNARLASHLQPAGPMTPCAVSSADALSFSSSTMISSTFRRCSKFRSEPKLCAAVASRPRTILCSTRYIRIIARQLAT